MEYFCEQYKLTFPHTEAAVNENAKEDHHNYKGSNEPPEASLAVLIAKAVFEHLLIRENISVECLFYVWKTYLNDRTLKLSVGRIHIVQS